MFAQLLNGFRSLLDLLNEFAGLPNELDASLNYFAELLDDARAAAGGYQPIPVNVSDTGQMIIGFKEGLRKLRQGDKATLFLPFDIAYGDRGTRGIPPKSNLIFEIEVVEVLKD